MSHTTHIQSVDVFAASLLEPLTYLASETCAPVQMIIYVWERINISVGKMQINGPSERKIVSREMLQDYTAENGSKE